jgi:hypothetical protein
MSWSVRLATMAIALAIAGNAWAGDEKPQKMPAGGVADPAGRVGYWPNSAGGIEALELSTGKLRWSAKDTNQPVLADADRLFALVAVLDKINQARIIALDAGKGQRSFESKPIEFPEWVRIAVARGHSFKTVVRLEKDKLLLTWEARAWYDRGAEPSEEEGKKARKNAAGIFQIDLRSGRVDSVKGLGQAMPDDLKSVTVGELVLTVNVGEPARVKEPSVELRARTLQATDAAGNIIWTHQIAPRVEFLPLK